MVINHHEKNRIQGLIDFMRTSITLVLVLLASGPGWAQQKEAEKDAYGQEIPRNVKVVREYTDKNGNSIREIQFSQGLMRVTQTIIMPRKLSYDLRPPLRIDTMDRDSIMLLVEKSKYSLKVFYKRQMVRNYKAVFGPRPSENKFMEGDRCTPEGWFTISRKNPNSKYNKFMLISYPNDSARVRFRELKAKGIIPANARIGGDIGIHGIWQGGDDLIEMGVGWTDGCVALKNQDVDELFSLVGVGTRVYIRK